MKAAATVLSPHKTKAQSRTLAGASISDSSPLPIPLASGHDPSPPLLIGVQSLAQCCGSHPSHFPNTHCVTAPLLVSSPPFLGSAPTLGAIQTPLQKQRQPKKSKGTPRAQLPQLLAWALSGASDSAPCSCFSRLRFSFSPHGLTGNLIPKAP